MTSAATCPRPSARRARPSSLGVGAGYAQGFGNISRGRGVGDVAGAGGTVGLSLGYRINPRFSVAASGAYQGFGNASATAVQIAAERAATVRGVSGGIEGTYHVSPYNRVDPHVTVGTGYRVLMESPPTNAPTTLTHGFELAKVEVGLDVRPSESIAISPVLGADLNMFMWRSGGGAETAALTSRGINTFVFAGIKGRFDIGGARDAKAEQQVGRR
ncbi:MAG: outer membrane beta-barrel protein [Minicystis sp.]